MTSGRVRGARFALVAGALLLLTGCGGLMKMAENRGLVLDAKSQSCRYIVTSPAGGRGRGLSRGRGHEGVVSWGITPKAG